MKTYIEKLPHEIRQLIRTATDTAHETGCKAYLVGGFVRDLILAEQNLDVDIAVEGDGIAFAHALALRLHGKLVTHKRFGTATIATKAQIKLDIAMTRKEFYPQPGSLPVVNSGSLKDDLFRRDFTINTLAISITKEDFATVFDSFGGKADIQHKKIRILHPLSFIDDPTRILRAVRFEQRLGFTLEPHTLSCLREAVRLKMLSCVQPQRLRDEVVLLLQERDPAKPFMRLQELTGLDFIAPHLVVTKRTLELFRRAQSQVDWFIRTFSVPRPLDTWLVYFMCLVDGLDSDAVGAACDRFVFKKGDSKRIMDYCAGRDKAIAKLSARTIRPSTVFHRLEPLSYEVIVALKAKAADPVVTQHIEHFFRAYHGTGIALKGSDLHGLGFTPGPHYQKIFRKVLNAKLNGKVSSAQDELEYARTLKRKHDDRRP